MHGCVWARLEKGLAWYLVGHLFLHMHKITALRKQSYHVGPPFSCIDSSLQSGQVVVG